MGWCLTLRNELSSVTHILQGKRLYEKWHLGGEKPGKGNQENCFAFWMTVSGFMVMGLVSRLSLANHSNSRSFLIVEALLSQDGFQWGGFGEADRIFGQASPPSFWPFPKSSSWWQLVNPEFLTRLSCCKITRGSGYYLSWPGWTVSVSISPNNFCWETSYSRFFLGIKAEVSFF